ncbi:MAG: hypothetical protein DDT19_01867 [Syntrophomonadaceae bacterium]|nr:hypothetical protein [Bacillota bacterium]
MADLLLDLINRLRLLAIVVGDGIDSFRDFMPDAPDKLVVLSEYAGSGTQTGAAGVARSVQVMVRTSRDDPEWAKNKAWEIFNVLDTPGDRILDTREHVARGTRWAVIAARQTPSRIRIDQNARSIYGFNLGVVTSRD